MAINKVEIDHQLSNKIFSPVKNLQKMFISKKILRENDIEIWKL